MPAITLRDGRRLAFREYGPSDGRPILYCHGAPSSSVEWQLFGGCDLANQLGVRIISPDRPGIGGSDPAPGRTTRSWPEDAIQLADDLGWHRFAVLGYSGGSGYAAATAAILGDRVTSCAIVACVYHNDRALEDGLDPNGLRLKKMVRDRPGVGRAVLAATMGMPARRLPKLLVRQAMSALPEEDQMAISSDRAQSDFVAAVKTAFTQGAAGPSRDVALMVTPWKVPLNLIRSQVMIWQGALDSFGARPAMAERVHELIPRSRLELRDEGHISILMNHREEIIVGLG